VTVLPGQQCTLSGCEHAAVDPRYPGAICRSHLEADDTAEPVTEAETRFETTGEHENPIDVSDVSDADRAAMLRECLEAFVSLTRRTDLDVSHPTFLHHLRIAFGPGAIGRQTTTLSVNAGNDTARVSLSGAGFGPDMAVSADCLDFRTAGLGTSATAELEIDNFGNRGLEIENVAITGDDADAFRIESGPNTIAPSASGSLEVRFSPEQSGAHDATLDIDGNDTAGLRTVDITGATVGADIVVNRSTIDFGETEIGRSYVEAVTVRNAGTTDANLTIEGLQMAGSHAEAFTVDDPDTPSVLAPGEERRIAINFTAQVGDARQAQLQIHSDAANQPQVNVWLSNTRGYITVQEVSNPTVNIEGTDLPADSRHLVNVSAPSTQASPVTVDGLEMTTEGDFEMNLSNGAEPFDNAFEADNDTGVVQYVELDHVAGGPAETFDDTGVHYRVVDDAVPEGVAPEEVTRADDGDTPESRRSDGRVYRRTQGRRRGCHDEDGHRPGGSDDQFDARLCARGRRDVRHRGRSGGARIAHRDGRGR